MSDRIGARRAAKRVDLEAIHDEIRDRICLLDYPPGTLLREGALASEFGVSRTPIRQILHRLEFAKLVEARNGVGTLVTSVERDALKDIYDMRLEVAEMIGELSPRDAKAEDLGAMEALLVRAEGLAGPDDIRAYWQINHEQHNIIAGLIGNRPLRELWDLYYFQTARIWYAFAVEHWAEVSKALVAEISESLRALKDGDIKGLGLVQRNYIAMGMRRALAHLAERAD